MSPDAKGTYGEHVVHEDFYHFASGSAANLGVGHVGGVSTEANVQVITETDGVMSLTTGGSSGDTSLFGLNAVFSPGTNGTLTLEARVKLPNISDAAAWVGFSTQTAEDDEVQDAGTIDGGTADCAGLAFDTGIDADQWNEYIATASAETQQNLVSEVLTAGEWQTLRVEIDPDGTVRTYISDELDDSVSEGGLRLIAERSEAVSTTALFFPEVYAATNTGGAKKVSIDYFHFTANRDWNVE